MLWRADKGLAAVLRKCVLSTAAEQRAVLPIIFSGLVISRTWTPTQDCAERIQSHLTSPESDCGGVAGPAGVS